MKKLVIFLVLINSFVFSLSEENENKIHHADRLFLNKQY